MKYHDYDILYHPSKQNIHPEDEFTNKNYKPSEESAPQ